MYVNSSYLWNLRLGHINTSKMIRMNKSGLLPQINFEDFNTCESCIKEKITSTLIQNNGNHHILLEIIHYDICDFLCRRHLYIASYLYLLSLFKFFIDLPNWFSTSNLYSFFFFFFLKIIIVSFMKDQEQSFYNTKQAPKYP